MYKGNNWGQNCGTLEKIQAKSRPRKYRKIEEKRAKNQQVLMKNPS